VVLKEGKAATEALDLRELRREQPRGNYKDPRTKIVLSSPICRRRGPPRAAAIAIGPRAKLWLEPMTVPASSRRRHPADYLAAKLLRHRNVRGELRRLGPHARANCT